MAQYTVALCHSVRQGWLYMAPDTVSLCVRGVTLHGIIHGVTVCESGDTTWHNTRWHCVTLCERDDTAWHNTRCHCVTLCDRGDTTWHHARCHCELMGWYCETTLGTIHGVMMWLCKWGVTIIQHVHHTQCHCMRGVTKHGTIHGVTVSLCSAGWHNLAPNTLSQSISSHKTAFNKE